MSKEELTEVSRQARLRWLSAVDNRDLGYRVLQVARRDEAKHDITVANSKLRDLQKAVYDTQAEWQQAQREEGLAWRR